MPVATFINYPASPGVNVVMRTKPSTSPLDIFAATGIYHRKQRRFRRNKYGVDQVNANLLFYSPMMKADTVIEGSADRWSTEMLEEISKREKGEITETEKRISQLGAGIGVVSAPAALFAAYQAAKAGKGNVPRGVVRGIGARLPKGRAKQRVLRAVKYLDEPKSRKAKAAALGAGLGIVGIQAANTAGDIVTSRAMANAQRER